MSTVYRPTIGIECHVQLNTVSKLFSGSQNDAREADPNTLVNHIDFGLPGALPVLNREAITLGVRAALALHTKPQLFSTFDRKHYFYPDLPMGYQITQYNQPIILGGRVDFLCGDQKKRVRITRAHLEADAGKSIHPAGSDYSLVDLNRAGTPLLEIVSEPDMHTPAEAKAYAQELYLLMRYAGVTAGDLFHGNMRFDVNVSISPNDTLGTRTETKNLNSFRAVEKAVDYEIKRQSELLNRGEKIVQETRGWDESKQKTVSQRSKENADDYRYMPDPDLPPVTLTEQATSQIAQSMPEGPVKLRQRLSGLSLSAEAIETLMIANLDMPAAGYLDLITATAKRGDNVKRLANWLINQDIPLMRNKAVSSHRDRRHIYAAVGQAIDAGQLNATSAKQLIVLLLGVSKVPKDILDYAQKQGMIQQPDNQALETVIDRVIADNPKAVADIASGQLKALGFLIGQIVQQTGSSANPGTIRKLLSDRLKIQA